MTFPPCWRRAGGRRTPRGHRRHHLAKQSDLHRVAHRFPEMLGAAGRIHPNNAAEAAADDWERVVALVGTARVVAIGETGLDRHWDSTPFALQEDLFALHLRLARQHNLPIIIHCREAEADVLRMLRDDCDRQGPLRGVMHLRRHVGDGGKLPGAGAAHFLRRHGDVQETRGAACGGSADTAGAVAGGDG